MAAIDVYLLYLSHVGIYPSLHPILSRIVQAVSPKDSGLGYIRVFAQEQITDRLDSNAPEKSLTTAETKGGKDFLSKLLALHAEDPSKVTMYDVIMTCGTNIGAGSDTACSLPSVSEDVPNRKSTLDRHHSQRNHVPPLPKS